MKGWTQWKNELFARWSFCRSFDRIQLKLFEGCRKEARIKESRIGIIRRSSQVSRRESLAEMPRQIQIARKTRTIRSIARRRQSNGWTCTQISPTCKTCTWFTSQADLARRCMKDHLNQRGSNQTENGLVTSEPLIRSRSNNSERSWHRGQRILILFSSNRKDCQSHCWTIQRLRRSRISSMLSPIK
jgi:hypothetical protein